MTNTVLITGVSGFLGQYIAREFSNQGWIVVGIDTLNIENSPAQNLAKYYQIRLPSPDLEYIVQEHAPRHCIHCAGRSSVEFSIQEPRLDFISSLEVTSHLLDTFRLYAKECKTLFLSSAAVYGNPQNLPISENHPPQPISPYGYHKLMAELLCQQYFKIYGLPTAILRAFSAYGSGLRRQVLWDLCQKSVSNSKLTLKGTGKETRDFIHAQDLAKAVFLAAQKSPFKGDIYNVAGGRETSIKELASMILKRLDLNIPIDMDNKKPVGVPLKWRADIKKINKLGFKPEISMKRGIDQYVRWFRIVMGVE